MSGRRWKTWQKGSAVAFSRAVAPPGADDLTAAMVGIGMNFAATGAAEPNIEDTLLFAAIEAMEKDDLRVLAVLVTWFGVHASWVNADRLTRLVSDSRSPRVRALWSALARWQSRDRRFFRLAKVYSGQPVDLLASGTAFQLKRHGEDPRFAASALRVPGNVLRNRGADVLAPEELAKRHHGYRRRVMFGPNYRADMWSVLELNPTLSAAELARRTYGSFATAWHVRRDFKLLSSAGRLAVRRRPGAERTT
jgi:hypothetical protein